MGEYELVYSDSRRDSNGFTLLELLIVLILIGFMVTLVVPRIGNTLTNIKLRAAARTVAACLRYASNRAVIEKKIYQVVIDINENSLSICQVNLEDDGKNNTLRSKGKKVKIIKRYILPKEINFGEVENSNADVTDNLCLIYFFDNYTSTGGSVILKANKKVYKLKIDVITSNVSIHEGDSA